MHAVRDSDIVTRRDAIVADANQVLFVAGGEDYRMSRPIEGIASLLPGATYVVLEGQDHGASPEAVAPVVASFVRP